jgi:hypothetical protein
MELVLDAEIALPLEPFRTPPVLRLTLAIWRSAAALALLARLSGAFSPVKRYMN